MAQSKPLAPFHVPTVSYTFLLSCVHIINEARRIKKNKEKRKKKKEKRKKKKGKIKKEKPI
jgi:uncharacterized ion transporter superfamily protein YfcC